MRRLYQGGTILTMDKKNSATDCMLCENGRILALNCKEKLLSNETNLEIVDLHGRTLLPGFIDSHSHLSSYASSHLQISLAGARSFDDILAYITEFLSSNKNAAMTGWITASGYNEMLFNEKKHPDKSLLDSHFPGIPIVLLHASGHFGVFSSAALSKVPLPDFDSMANAYRWAFAQYASYGITTVQEGLMTSQMLPLYQMLLANKLFSLDVIGYPSFDDAPMIYEALKIIVMNTAIIFGLADIKSCWMARRRDELHG